MKKDISDRIRKLQEFLTNEDEAAVVLSDVNRFYLTGFKSSSGLVFITKKNAYLVVDFRYGEAAKKEVRHTEVVVYSKLSDTIANIVKKHNIKNVYFENDNITLKQADLYKNMLVKYGADALFTKDLDKIIDNMRILKSEDEIEKIEMAQKITEKAYTEVLNYIKPGVCERDIAIELEYLMRKKGAEGVAFDLITITGTNTSLPHGVPGDITVKTGDLFIMDIGALYDGYRSDMTRTVAVGMVSDEQEKIYNIVLDAQKSALEKIAPGVGCGQVDAAARNVISNAGYGDCFGHSTGHGVGLDIHESPFVTYGSEKILSPGMVITCEPGIYIPDKFGVRIEDMVLVTEEGIKNFTTVKKELTIL